MSALVLRSTDDSEHVVHQLRQQISMWPHALEDLACCLLVVDGIDNALCHISHLKENQHLYK